MSKALWMAILSLCILADWLGLCWWMGRAVQDKRSILRFTIRGILILTAIVAVHLCLLLAFMREK